MNAFARVASAAAVATGVVLVSSAVGVGSSPKLAHAQGTLAHSPTPVSAASYASEIQPMFDAKCVSCHGGEWEGESRLEASLNLMSYDGVMAGSEFGSVVEPGDVGGSILFEMLEAGDMPEEGDPLTPDELELVRQWIAEGAENN